MQLTQKIASAAAGAALVLTTLAGTALAANGYSLFGEASYVSPGNASTRAVKTVSDTDPGFGGIDYDIAAGTTFADLQALSTDYMFESDDSCMGGSPRFQVAVEDPVSGDAGNIFVYIGPPPNYTGCPAGVWLNSGDLLEGVNPIDTTQLSGGTFYDPYATALTKYGSYNVTGVQLVTDGGWAANDGEQTVTFDNTLVDETLYDYEPNVPTSKDECKNGGWQELEGANGQPFKNQGDCVSYFSTGGKNQPAGTI
jgi:hypothetical protein